MPGLVLDRYRPTLRDVLGSRLGIVPRPLRWVLAVVAAGLVALLAYQVLKPADRGIEFIQRAPIPFNFAYTSALAPEPAQGDEFVRLVRRQDGRFRDSFAVEPLVLPAYDGEVGGFLPLYADREIAALSRRFDEFELVEEGKTRVILVPGYGIVFRARLGERRLYGRVVLLPEPVPETRRGAKLVLLATPAAGATKAADVGFVGATKRPYRTFRFGTEPP